MLQSVVKQCMSYDKDPWKGPVGKDRKPARTPSANAAGTSGDKSNPYKVMASCLFGNHMSRWQAGCKDGSKHHCMICHNTLNKPAHHSRDCPILKQIGLKLVKCTPGNGGNAESRVGHEAPATAPAHAPLAAPVPAAVKNGGSTGTPGATVATKDKSYNSGDEFDYKGKYEGLVFSGKTKPNASLYPHASHATAETTEDTHPPAKPPPPTTSCRHSTSSMDPTGVCTVQLPK
jgi:hypothetical protein